MPTATRFFLRCSICACAIALAACATRPEYNPTVFNYELSESYRPDAIKSVVIAHVNLGASSRTYLERQSARVDAKVAAYLKKNGYEVLPQQKFSSAWNNAVRAYGNPIDPTTSRVNRKTFSKIMVSVRDRLRETIAPDAIVFTDLVELEVPFSNGIKRVARWDGVSRKPALQGAGAGVSTDFDWNQPVRVASLMIGIYDMELQRLFLSRGGISATQAIDTRDSSGGFVKRRSMLSNDNHIDQGIELAFHPFIPMKMYPGPKNSGKSKKE